MAVKLQQAVDFRKQCKEMFMERIEYLDAMFSSDCGDLDHHDEDAHISDFYDAMGHDMRKHNPYPNSDGLSEDEINRITNEALRDALEESEVDMVHFFNGLFHYFRA
jgi:hypothetical protein